MTSIEITSVTGLNPPYTVYACNGYGLNCVLIGIVNVTPSVLILPPQFNGVPGVGIKIITSDGCERFQIILCDEDNKQFQDYEDFYFQDGLLYYFQ